MPLPHDNTPDRGPRAATSGAVLFAAACIVFLLGSLTYVALFGIGGGPGAMPEGQQQAAPATSAPNATGTRETQGYSPPNTAGQQ
jgi:hypothetical protein